MVRHVRTKNRRIKKTKRKSIRHANRTEQNKIKLSGSSIVRCPKCKDGRIMKSRGLTFCGYCGHEFN